MYRYTIKFIINGIEGGQRNFGCRERLGCYYQPKARNIISYGIKDVTVIGNSNDGFEPYLFEDINKYLLNPHELILNSQDKCFCTNDLYFTPFLSLLYLLPFVIRAKSNSFKDFINKIITNPTTSYLTNRKIAMDSAFYAYLIGNKFLNPLFINNNSSFIYSRMGPSLFITYNYFKIPEVMAGLKLFKEEFKEEIKNLKLTHGIFYPWVDEVSPYL